MKHGRFIVAGSALSLLASSAMAQSTVALYGIIDAGISYTHNVKGGSLWQESSGKLGGNRWGVKGNEDLGDGLSAIFTLESGFYSTNGTLGQGGREFGRQAFVGLAKQDVGALTFGRQYDPLADLVAPYFGSGFWIPSTHVGDNDNLDQSFRINNAVKFRSDAFAGWRLDALYGFSNQASGSGSQGFANNNAWALAINTTQGPVSVGGGYMQLNHPNATSNTSGAVGGASSTTGDDYSSGFFYGIDGGVARQRIAALGGNVVWGPATVGLGVSHVQLDYNDGATRKLTNVDANLRYRLSAPWMIVADYTFTDGRVTSLPGTGGADLKPTWHQINLAVDYLLSKRTELYVTAGYQKALGDGTTSVGGHYRSIAAMTTAGGASSTNTQFTVATGVRHRF
ncbi:gram-negative porin family protein [Burkholderia thailandensis MSMB121]|uniref:porin n=1 Tax=Burkholderia humptydooensis TaxID=430531 RepID=UPI0003280476|nr:porin [Burkholderia humptydooensis]AGK47946.1 gram-negative porin family protein [Burkholderia thailandensis MSMB121]ATF37224.1 porin [Burkholderia thailandensis]KST74598.1 porin [Burkholderia humptydooensis]